jgi:hypothetical protein
MPEDDIHGYVRLAKLLVWPAIFALIAIVIAVGIILSTARSAH